MTSTNPKIYIKGLSKEERKLKYPEGTYVLVDGKLNIMKNNKPYFTTLEKKTNIHSKCYGKFSIIDCPEDECVFHIKSKQCRLKKYSSEAVINADRLLRAELKNSNNTITTNLGLTKKKQIKLLNTLQSFIDDYDNEKEEDYLRKIIKKLNKILRKYENKLFNNLSFNKYSKSGSSNIYQSDEY